MPSSEAELEPLLRLALVPGVGHLRLAQLVERFGSAPGVLRAPDSALRDVSGIGGELARRIRAAGGARAAAAAGAALGELRRSGAVALTPDDEVYPATFRQLPDPPFLLFAAGDLSALRRPAVAVVGTRSPTAYGRDAATSLSRDLARAGYVVVSGMARGVDTAAHAGALEAGGPTIGILGHGIGQIYPPENRWLFAKVRERGLLLTEYLPAETPKAGNFPRRNRLIASLSQAVLVVEMGHASGAQHTVTFALQQGKEVMAVPGQIGSRASAGTNQLIKDGARLVTSVADVIEELHGVGAPGPAGLAAGARVTPSPANPSAGQAHTPVLPLLTAPEGRVLGSLAGGERHIDELSAEAELPPGEALAVLLELELRGLIAALPGKRFARR